MRWTLPALLALSGFCACATTRPPPKPTAPPPGLVSVIKYNAKTEELVKATHALGELRDNIDEQRRRLTRICVDYPDHEACQLQTAAAYARKTFCSDKEFTGHINEVVKSCHQGQCKQVDQANLITRGDYMMLVQRLPHALITFGAGKTKLDRTDRKQLQRFIETIQAEKGYMIIVGRASKDGSWRKNLEYALGRAESSRKFLVEDLGIDAKRVGYITYGHAKMYLTSLDAERLTTRKLSVKQANRSALVFTYPCWDGQGAH